MNGSLHQFTKVKSDLTFKSKVRLEFPSKHLQSLETDLLGQERADLYQHDEGEDTADGRNESTSCVKRGRRQQEFWHERFWLLMETKWLLFIGDGTAEAKETEESLRFFRRSCLSFLQLSSCSPITPVGQWWPKGWRTELVTWRSQVQSIRIEEDLLLSYYLHRVQKVPSR